MNELRTPAAVSTAGRLDPGWWRPALTRQERAGADTSRPAWCEIAEQVVILAAPPATLPDTSEWREALAVPLRPFALLARDQVARSARQFPGLTADPDALARSCTAALPARLAHLALRTLMAELHAAHAAGRLPGRDDRERLAGFLRQMCEPEGLAALLARYPVLARLLANATIAAADATTELLNRLATDRQTLVDTLLRGADPGPVTTIEPGQGDPHQRGRTVTIVGFADGRKVVYKPRSLDAYAEFSRVASWVNQQAGDECLQTARILARPGYGWMELVEYRPLHQARDAGRFYRRAGALLAVMHALNAMDMHFENIIADGDRPVPIDVETIVHPELPVTDNVAVPDPAAHALAASVRRTGLLPYFTIGENGMADRSGLGGDPGTTAPEPVVDWDPPGSAAARLVLRPALLPTAANRPRGDGQVIEPADYETEILSGFRFGYTAIARHRDAFAALLRSLSAPTRVIIRPTSGYASLLAQTTDPGLLADAADREQALDLLDEASASHPLWRRLAPYERAALWAGDIPLVLARPGDEDLWTGDGERLPRALERSGLRCALDKLAAMGEIDRGEQEWIIRASLATRRPAAPHPVPPSAASQATVLAQPGALLSAAAGIADEIVARSTVLRGDPGQERLNWLGLQLVAQERWLVLPMGASLGDGYVGVALFFAQLAKLTGIERYAQAARRALLPVPALLAALDAHAGDVLADVGGGADGGLGGISYGLARLATLLEDRELADLAETAADLAGTAIALQGEAVSPDWAGGLAGCLASMTAVHQETGSATAARLADSCAGQLAVLARQAVLAGQITRTGQTMGQPRTDAAVALPPGFASGIAGIGGALAQFAAQFPGAQYADVARATVRAAASRLAGPGGSGPGSTGQGGASRGGIGPGWCCGTAGLLAATALTPGETAPTAALLAPADRPLLSDLSLRHGELGIVDATADVAAASDDPAVRRGWQRHADLILAAVQRHGPACATPGGIPTPGLLDGLAGIGYGLLRLARPDTVPSVLLLAPTPAGEHY